MKRKRLAVLLALAMGMSTCSMTGFAAYTDQDTVKSVQEALNKAGYDCGTPDGLFGSKTGDAISSYQESSGLEVSGEIDDALLAALGLAGEDGAAAASEVQNEEAWDALYQVLEEKGMAIEGMKGFFTGSDDYHTVIGIAEGDQDNIYFYTKGDYGSSGAETITDLKIALKKNEGSAEFQATSDLELYADGISAYTKEEGSGHVAIATVTTRTELSVEKYRSETLDVNGNTKTTEDPSECIMNASITKSLNHLLTDAEQILKDNTSITMKELGFYTELNSDLTLAENEAVRNITADVYAVFPKGWKEVDMNNGGFNFYPPEAGDANVPVLLYTVSEISGNVAMFSHDQVEQMLESGFTAFNKNGYLITQENTGIEIAGFQGRSASVVRSDSGTNYTFEVTEFIVDNSLVMIGIMQQAGAETDYTDVYQRLIDSIFVDASGTVAEAANAAQGGDETEEGSDAEPGMEADGEAADSSSEASEDSNVLLDNEIATVTYVEPVEGSNYIGAKLLIENKTDDKTVMMNADNTSVNGYMQYMSLNNSVVAPGMKSYAELVLYTSDSPVTSLDEYVNVGGTLRVWYNEDGGSSYSDSTDPVPFEILQDAEASDELVSGLKNSQEILFENEDVSIGYLGTVEKDNRFGAKLLIENRTADKTLMLDAKNTAIDGFMTNMTLYNSIAAPGKVSVCELDVYNDNEVASSLEQFVNVTGTFEVWYNEDGSSSYSGKIDGGNFKILQ